MASLAPSLAPSELTLSLSTPDPAQSAFQLRRRRAAKLTQFFGVDYRDLMNEVFESLEMGLEEEQGRGTLRPEEAAVRYALPMLALLLG